VGAAHGWPHHSELTPLGPIRIHRKQGSFIAFLQDFLRYLALPVLKDARCSTGVRLLPVAGAGF
jgi:hypothetical protein